MSPPWEVAFPVPMRFVPRRGRTQAIGYAPGRMPARVREVSEAEAPAVGSLRLSGQHGTMPLRLLDGRLWRPILSWPVPDAAASGPATLDAAGFRDWLAGGQRDGTGMDGGYVGRHFAGSPLLARLRHYGGHTGADVTWDRATGGRVIEDGSGRAASAAAAFLDAEVALVGGLAHRRCRGPLAVTSNHGASYQVLAHPGAFEHFLAFREADLCRLDRVEAHREAHRGRPGVPLASGTPPALSWPSDLLNGLLDGDDDVRLFVNEAPRWLDCADAQRTPQLRFLPGSLDEAARDDLLSTLAWGGVGGVGDDGDLEGACRRVLRLVSSMEVMTGIGNGLAGRVRAYAARYALPLVAAPAPVAEEDARALAGL